MSVKDKKSYTVYLNSEDRQNPYIQTYGVPCTCNASISGREMTISNLLAVGNTNPNITKGMIVTGNYFLTNTYITSQLRGNTGTDGTYLLNTGPGEPVAFVISEISSNLITVSSVTSGTLGVGVMLTPIPNTDANYANAQLPSEDAWWIPPNTYIIAQNSGTTGGVGIYALNQYLPISLVYNSFTFTLNSRFFAEIENPNTPYTLTVKSISNTDITGVVFVGNITSGSNVVVVTSITNPGNQLILCYSGSLITGAGIPPNTYLNSQTSGTTGKVGTYTMSKNATATSSSLSINQSGIAILPGMCLAGLSSDRGQPYITRQLSGTIGGEGTYTISVPATTSSIVNITGLSTILCNQSGTASTTFPLTATGLLINSYCGFDNCTINQCLSGTTNGLGYFTLTNKQFGGLYPMNSGLINNGFPGGNADFYQQYNVGTGMLSSTFPTTVYTGTWGEMDAVFTCRVSSQSSLTITNLASGALALPTGIYSGSQIYYNGNMLGTVSSFSGYNYQGLVGTIVNLAQSQLTNLGIANGTSLLCTSITADENWSSTTQGL